MHQRIEKVVSWWLTGLVAALPSSLRNKLLLSRDRLVITEADGTLSLKLYAGGSGALLGARSIDINDELNKSDTMQWIKEIDKPVEVIHVFDGNEILKKTVTLPLASEKDLYEIMGFEMDRQTPFSADKVYYDCRVNGRDEDNDRLSVSLFVTPKQKLDQLLEKLNALRLAPETVTFSENGEIQHGVNLLPETLKPPKARRVDPLTLALVACTCILFIAALYAPLLYKQSDLDALETVVNNYRKQALSVQPLIEERDKVLARTRFLEERQRDNQKTIAILNELTRVLPDNTWLSRLIIREGELQLHGESDAALKILQLVEDSALLRDAQFRSPVTQNNITKKDKFHVSAVFEKGPAT